MTTPRSPAGLAFENAAEILRRIHAVLLRLRVQIPFSRREQHVYVFLLQLLDVVLQRTRISVKVFVGPELQPVHEILAATGSPCWLASRINEKCPSCRFPIVGTKAVLFWPRDWSRSSWIERIIFMV